MSALPPEGVNGPESARTGAVGAMVPLVYDLYFSALLAGVAEGAYEQGVRLILAPTRHEHAREASVLDRVMKGGTDGTLIILPEESRDELERILSGGYPVVVIEPLLALGERIPCVTAAHRSGADQAMRHLLDLGHRRIAAITGPPGWVATEERRAGYREGLAAADIPFDDALEAESDFEIEPGAAAAGMLLDLPDPPTAIFGFNDSIAIGALRAARERGLHVPEDVSVLGFDDVKYTTVVTPALTTVRQPLGEMGRTAVDLLLRLIEGRSPAHLQFELATQLVVRESTGPPVRAR